MTELTLIEGKPQVFLISTDKELINEIREYVEGYDYEYIFYCTQ